jgi:NADH-quinone oxidoreductase subunit J
VTLLFYAASVVAVVATLLVVTRRNLIHALLYLVVSLMAVATVFFTLGAPFVAALEVIVYAGAIMMLFVFAVMLLDLRADDRERMSVWGWRWPVVFAGVFGVLLVQLVVLTAHGAKTGAVHTVAPQQVSDALFGPYVLGVELASMLLLAALVGARHLADRRDEPDGAANEPDDEAGT